MDPSALIFVALAVAWAAYLIPKALEHHEEGTRTRTIDRFSHGLRILARREPRSRRRSELVTVADAPPEPEPEPVPAPLTERERRALRRAFARAARRRRRVLDLLVLAVVAVAAVVLLGYLVWHWLGVPAALVLLWLVACRRMRVREKRKLAPAPAVAPARAVTPLAAAVPVAAVTWMIDDDPTTDVPAVAVPILDAEPTAAPGSWELQPLLVPTYVAKDTAPRSVRTIDLDSTGVFSAGRSASDSALVRESERDTPDADADAAPAVRRAASS